MQVEQNGANFIVRMPRSKKAELSREQTQRGLVFSLSASSNVEAVLFTSNPYAVADLEGAESLEPLRREILLSHALEGEPVIGSVPADKELWPYQNAALRYILKREGGLLAEPMGLGKTSVSIAFCNALGLKRVLVVVPASLRLQWQSAVKRWSTIEKVKVSAMLETRQGINPAAHYQIVSYDACTNADIHRAISRHEWDCIILDEGHYCKSVDAARTRAIFGALRDKMFRPANGRQKVPALRSRTKRLLILTGTPALNRPSELFSLVNALDPECIDFSSFDAFKMKYNPQQEWTGRGGARRQTESVMNETELQNRLRANIMTRHEKKSVLTQLKPPRFSLVCVEPTGEIRQALKSENLIDMDLAAQGFHGNAELLAHVAEARRLMGEAIAPQAARYLKDVLDGSDEKIVVFGWHINVLNILEAAFKPYGCVRVDGSKSVVNRQKSVDAFMSDGKVRVFLANLQTGGTGVDGLQTVSSRVFIVEPDWVPEQNMQAVARLDRIGQANVVQAEIFIAPGSITERILVKALEKMNVLSRVLNKKEA